jgi:hypothetical protein
MGGGDFPIRLYGDTIQALKGAFMKFVDRTGQLFGKLTVVEQAGRDRLKKVLWRCRCECGAETVVVSGSLVTGNTTSCGCVLKAAITKHGGWKKASYNTWRAMIRRCTVPTDKDYPRYGGRGVSVCPEWLQYENFVADMGEPAGDETLDRKDVYGNYTPENCRWAGVKTQNRNTRLRANSKTGFTGVSQVGNRFMAKVTVGKKAYYSKVVATVEEAAAARKELERLYWGIA